MQKFICINEIDMFSKGFFADRKFTFSASVWCMLRLLFLLADRPMGMFADRPIGVVARQAWRAASYPGVIGPACVC